MLDLTCAISEYDHVRDIASGRVRAEGISISVLNMPVEEVFYRSQRFGEFDISEMSMGRYVSLLSRGECPFVAIPVFPSRMFRHSSIYVRRDADIRAPADLGGKRIGVPEWAQTAGIYARGALIHQFGLSLTAMEWVQAGIQQQGREEEVIVRPPEGVKLTIVADRALDEMLLAGDLDALITAHPPHSFEKGDERVGRLFPDFQPIEENYWKDTGVFPIMHVIVIRRDVFEKHRWIAMNLMQAFEEAMKRGMERLREITAARFPLPWSFEYARRIAATFGNDYWPYGLDANQTTLGTFLAYAHEQGVTARPLSVEELFPPEVRSRFKI